MTSQGGHPLSLTGKTISFEWKVEELGTHDTRTGLRQCVVHEIYHGDDVPDAQRLGPMPCVSAEAFIRVRRRKAQEMMSAANGIKLIQN